MTKSLPIRLDDEICRKFQLNPTVMFMRKGGNKMKKLIFGALLLALVVAVPVPTMADVDVGIGISIGLPSLVFAAPPSVVVLPDTYGVYVVPDIDAELYFYGGWWWRLWDGRWYRSRYYDRGYLQYYRIPTFYYDVDPGWRRFYYDRHWHGHRWDYEPIPHSRLHANWRNWNTNRYWERQRTWGVQGYQPRLQPQRRQLRQERERQYQQRPEVQRQRQSQERTRGQQQMQPQTRQPRQQSDVRTQGKQQTQPQVRQPRQQSQERTQGKQMQPKARQPQKSKPQQRTSERGEEGKRERR